jgi:hypothetical protein
MERGVALASAAGGRAPIGSCAVSSTSAVGCTRAAAAKVHLPAACISYANLHASKNKTGESKQHFSETDAGSNNVTE